MESRDLEVLAWRLFEESNDGVFLLDADTETIQQANPAAQRLTGFRWRKLRNRRIGEIVLSKETGDEKALLSAIHETGYFHAREPYLLCRDDADPIPVNVSVSRIHVPSGLLGVVVVRDVTERKQAEQALKDFNLFLEARVTAKTAELRNANRQLQDEIEDRKSAERELQSANKKLADTIERLQHAQDDALRKTRLNVLEQVAGGIAHDINNALTASLAYSELLNQAGLKGDAREWADSVRHSTLDIAGIVRRLRQFYQGRDHDRRLEPVNLKSLLAETIDLTRPKWRDAAMRLGKDIRVELRAVANPHAMCDTTEIRSVITNLIFNAVDAVAKQGQIDVRLGETAQEATVEIRDDGAGMTGEVLERCLDPYFSTKPEGSGLGLSVCTGIVRSFGGTLEVDSELGAGTTIRLSLPKPKNDEPSSAASVSALEREFIRGLKLLYVDDNDNARRSLAALLHSMGFDVDTADCGLAGWEKFLANNYDAVLTDMTMPGMDGLSLAGEIKRHSRSVPVIVLTGWPVEPSSDLDKQPDAVLGKPLEFKELEVALVRLCQDEKKRDK